MFRELLGEDLRLLFYGLELATGVWCFETVSDEASGFNNDLLFKNSRREEQVACGLW